MFNIRIFDHGTLKIIEINNGSRPLELKIKLMGSFRTVYLPNKKIYSIPSANLKLQILFNDNAK